MKLQCKVEVVNRLHSNLNIRSSGKYLKSTLALGQEPKVEPEYFIILFSSVNRCGTKYSIKRLKQVFTKCLNEGKTTLRFEEPPHDLCIKSEAIQLKCFMKLLKLCITGDKDGKVAALTSLSVTHKDHAPTRLLIRDRSEFPAKGFPRTLETLSINGLNLSNFRRNILLLKQLTVLDLGNNAIEVLPPELGRMCLCELHLSNNQIGVKGEVDWRWLLGPQIIKSLKLLDLSGNKIGYLPKAIWKLQQLITLKVDNNMLGHLPTTLGRISTLRYLTISQNKLTYLPCSLLHCVLEYIDVSENKFCRSDIETRPMTHTPWEFYIGSLVDMASKVVLKEKFLYAPNIIPLTLVEFLDNANLCVCGKPVVNNGFYMKKDIELKEYFSVAVFNSNASSTVPVQCYFCSPRCFSRRYIC